jgi:transcriptional regulator with XRE-family HTH domain
VGISAPYLSDIEKDQRWPSPKVVGKLAEKLGMMPATLLAFDPAPDLDHLRRLLRTTPGLHHALRTTLRKIQAGEMSPESLAKRLNTTAKHGELRHA